MARVCKEFEFDSGGAEDDQEDCKFMDHWPHHHDAELVI